MPTRRPGAVLRDDSELALQAVGRELRTARLARGEDLHDIAAYLRIRPAYLMALEQGDVAATPGGPYATGFLRNYGDYLGLDGRSLVARLRPAVATAAPPRALTHRGPLSESRRPTVSMVTASLVLMGALYAGYHLFVVTGEGPPAEIAEAPASELQPPAPSSPVTPPLVTASAVRLALEPVPAVAAVVSPAPDVTSAVAAENAQAAELPARLVSLDNGPAPAAAAAIDTPARVVLVAREDSWVQLRSPDRTFIRTRTMLPGERFAVPERGDLALWTANAGGIELVLDGRSMGVLGAPGATVRDFPLAPDGLKLRQTTVH